MAHPPLPPGDDGTIPDVTILWRRIPPIWWLKDPATGIYRLTSEAFDDARDKSPLSVAIAAETTGIEAFLEGYIGNGIAAFTAGYARHTCHLAVARDPVQGEPWHAHVIGKKRPNVRKLLRDGCTMIVIPREE